MPAPAPRPRVVVFDFFGTLAHATASVGLDEILARHGHTIPDHLQEMWWSGDIDGTEHVEQSPQPRPLPGLAARAAWWRCSREADVHPGEHEQILDDLAAGRRRRVLEAYDEVPGVLAELRARGVGLVVCSNWDWDLEPRSRRPGSRTWFDTVVSSAWAGARKPHPRIYRYLIEQPASTRPTCCSSATPGGPTSPARSPRA